MKNTQSDDPEMLDDYDFSDAPRGKYGPHYAPSNVVLLEADVAKVFKDAEAVNKALRGIIEENAKSKPTARKRAS
jgi:hypothetical protein